MRRCIVAHASFDSHRQTETARIEPGTAFPIWTSLSARTMATYEQLHRQCRTLENLLDTKLTSYSQLVSAVAAKSDDVEANGSADRWKDLELEVDDLLEKVRTWPRNSWSPLQCPVQLEETNEKLSELSSNPDTLSPSMLRAIQRHRELFQDSVRDVKRTKVRAAPSILPEPLTSLSTGKRQERHGPG